jgi:CTP synthase (UTP-ammonia lyase)
VEESTRQKISVFCHVAPSHVLSVHDVSNIYHVPLILAEQNLHGIIRCVYVLLSGQTHTRTHDREPIRSRLRCASGW